MKGLKIHSILSSKPTLFLVISVLLLAAVVPANAANQSVSSYVVQDQPYTPYPVFLLTLGLGIIFLLLSLVLSGDQNNDAFAALAIIPLFVSSWMALQLDFTMGGIAGTVSDNVLRVDHLIYPQSILAYVLFALGCVAIFQLYRVLTANRTGSEYKDGWQEKEYHDY